ncbi:MAG TPA: shikimate kinase [Bryobacteraceae bacterium]|nr:shikimate kinase [Bryobacteraceae bacterium]HPT27470.1 shikimate kinase [Bryobacteraceae bacterium]
MILKLKRTPGIYMVGFMGSGKTTVGRALARHLGWRYADLDEDIESKTQKSIPEIFDEMGEPHFRQLETALLERRVHDIACGVPWVLSLGGGCFAQERNFDLIQNHGVSIWLDAPLDLIKSRVAGHANRPLARDPEKFEQLYHDRRAYYEMAHYRIPVTAEGSSGALKSILELPLF